MLLSTIRGFFTALSVVFLVGTPPILAVDPGLRGVSSPAADPAKIAGVWRFTVELEIGTGHPTVTLKQEGEKLTGTYDGRYGASPLEGTIKENKIEFTVAMTAEGASVTGVFSGVVEGDGENQTMHGAVDFDQAGEGTWTAVKAAAK